MPDDNSAREGTPGSSEPAADPSEPASERLPAKPGNSVPEGENSGVSEDAPAEDAPAEESFAEDMAGAEAFSQKALSERTRKTYRRAWEDFTNYCEEVGKVPLPARPVIVAAYITNRARSRPTARGAPKGRSSEGLAVSTLEQRLAAIKHYHESGGHASPTDHPQVSHVIRGIRNDEGRQEDIPRMEAAPLVSGGLKQALEVLPGGGPAPPQSETAEHARWLRGLRDRALLLLGFATALRPRELVSIERRHVAQENHGSKEGLIVHIPRSKTDQEAAGQTVTALKNKANPTYCPVRALFTWRRAASIEDGPLFRGVRRDGAVLSEAISYRTLNRMVKRTCKEAGLEAVSFSKAKQRQYSAHSLRAGHVTDASSNGAPDNVLMMQTRHADPKTLRKYDRPAQQMGASSSAFLRLY
ncbi:integrase [Salinibacter ruber]|uniref:Integrase n=1 Tax=Salinibacter ruber TaxID=146919 RepID=A0A9X2THZ9_9BACT|nr:site-specific integrase [Salinibacter ruber]MCS3679246.1 integrase [Salinibacter ruber]MCS3682548.1 integrase [Salinibacter ruber]